MNENNPRNSNGGEDNEPYFEDIESLDAEPNGDRDSRRHPEEAEQSEPGPAEMRDRRSIRNIPLGNQTRKHNIEREKMKERYASTHRRKRGKGGLYILLTVLLVVFFFFLFVGVSLFAQATVTVVPRSEAVEIDETLTLSQNNTGNQALTYDVVTVELTRSESLPATSEEEVSRSATGRVTVSNTYSEDDQPIVARTRFETEDGRVYRAPEAFMVPGMTSDGEPGTVTVTVVADEPGEEYDVNEATFTLPGLEGTDMYTAFRAETATPITGGFVGVEKTVAESEEEATRESLRQTLESELREAVAEQTEEDALLVDDSLFIDYENLPLETDGDNVVIAVRGTLYGVAFTGDDLARFIAEETLSNYDNSPVAVANADNVTLDLEEGTDLTLDSLQREITVTIAGSPTLVWQISTEELVERIIGDPKHRALDQIGSFPGVASGSLEVRPGFVRKLPSEVGKVDIVVENPAS